MQLTEQTASLKIAFPGSESIKMHLQFIHFYIVCLSLLTCNTLSTNNQFSPLRSINYIPFYFLKPVRSKAYRDQTFSFHLTFLYYAYLQLQEQTELPGSSSSHPKVFICIYIWKSLIKCRFKVRCATQTRQHFCFICDLWISASHTSCKLCGPCGAEPLAALCMWSSSW